MKASYLAVGCMLVLGVAMSAIASPITGVTASSTGDPAGTAAQLTDGITQEKGWAYTQFLDDPAITFDLGAVYTLDKMTVWNYGSATTDVAPSHGVDSVNILVSLDGTTWTDLGASKITKSPWDYGTGVTPATDIVLGGVSAKFVKMDVNSLYLPWVFGHTAGHASNNPNGGMQGNAGWWDSTAFINEVQFTAVPEPATMSLLALSGLALLRRGRKA